MHDEYAEKGHFFARVLKYDAGVIWLATQAVGRHHHGQIVHIHLSLTYIYWLCKDLWGERSQDSIQISQILFSDILLHNFHYVNNQKRSDSRTFLRGISALRDSKKHVSINIYCVLFIKYKSKNSHKDCFTFIIVCEVCNTAVTRPKNLFIYDSLRVQLRK